MTEEKAILQFLFNVERYALPFPNAIIPLYQTKLPQGYMKALLLLFADICRFKKGPEDISYSVSLFILLFVCNLIIEILLGLGFYSAFDAALLSLTSILMLFAFSWIWLYLFKYNSRFVQTITAFVGISLFTNLFFFVPLTLLWQGGIIIDQSFALINLTLLAWILAIYAHIFRRALEISFFLGIALAITYFISYSNLSNYFLGVN